MIVPPAVSAAVILSLAFVSGIALGLSFPTPIGAALAALSVGLAALLASAWSGRRVALTSIAVLFAAGWARPAHDRIDAPIGPSMPCDRVAEGRLASPPVLLAERTRMAVDLERVSGCLEAPATGPLWPTTGRLYLTVPATATGRLEQGDGVRLRGRLRPIAALANPGVPATALTEDRYSAVLDSPRSVALVERGWASRIPGLGRAREALARFWIHALDPREAALARAFTLGETGALDPTTREVFRRTGTAHLLAVSGLQVSLVALFAFGLLGRALRAVPWLARQGDPGRIAALLSMPPVIAFSLLAGAQIPVVRAAVMSGSALLARALGRSAGTVEALALAGAAIVAADPRALLDPGFQLSFAAVTSFVAVLWRPGRDPEVLARNPLTGCSRAPRLVRSLREAARSLVRSCLAASAATTPIAMAHFGYASWISVPVNLLAVPLSSFLVMPLLFLAALLAGPWPAAAVVLARAGGAGLGCLGDGLTLAARLPCTIENPGPLAAAAIGALSVSALLFLAQRRLAAKVAWIGFAALAVAAAGLARPPFSPGRLTVDFLDVGQGDATLLTFPDGRHWLIDAGGGGLPPYDAGTRVVAPVLRGLGVRSLETLVLTHPDLDHLSGVAAVLGAIDVEAIWDNRQGEAEDADAGYGLVRQTARRLGVPVRNTPDICGVHRIGGAMVSVLHPCDKGRPYDPDRSPNDNSIVLAVTLGRFGLVFPGDIGEAAEQALARQGAWRRAYAVKLPHHGGRASSSPVFLDRLAPRIAVASLGLFNRYGMPHPEVLDRLRSRRIPLLRTDRHGAIRIEIDGERIAIGTFKNARGAIE